jgi:hypothetical protein
MVAAVIRDKNSHLRYDGVSYYSSHSTTPYSIFHDQNAMKKKKSGIS